MLTALNMPKALMFDLRTDAVIDYAYIFVVRTYRDLFVGKAEDSESFTRFVDHWYMRREFKHKIQVEHIVNHIDLYDLIDASADHGLLDKDINKLADYIFVDCINRLRSIDLNLTAIKDWGGYGQLITFFYMRTPEQNRKKAATELELSSDRPCHIPASAIKCLLRTIKARNYAKLVDYNGMRFLKSRFDQAAVDALVAEKSQQVFANNHVECDHNTLCINDLFGSSDLVTCNVLADFAYKKIMTVFHANGICLALIKYYSDDFQKVHISFVSDFS